MNQFWPQEPEFQATEPFLDKFLTFNPHRIIASTLVFFFCNFKRTGPIQPPTNVVMLEALANSQLLGWIFLKKNQPTPYKSRKKSAPHHPPPWVQFLGHDFFENHCSLTKWIWNSEWSSKVSIKKAGTASSYLEIWNSAFRKREKTSAYGQLSFFTSNLGHSYDIAMT